MNKIDNNEQVIEKRVFMEPGRTNKEDRLNFIKFWADYIRTHPDEEWSRQQNILINSQMKSSSIFKRHDRLAP